MVFLGSPWRLAMQIYHFEMSSFKRNLWKLLTSLPDFFGLTQIKILNVATTFNFSQNWNFITYIWDARTLIDSQNDQMIPLTCFIAIVCVDDEFLIISNHYAGIWHQNSPKVKWFIFSNEHALPINSDEIESHSSKFKFNNQYKNQARHRSYSWNSWRMQVVLSQL